MIGFFRFYGISTIVGYRMANPLYTYISNIFDLVWLRLVLWNINDCWLFYAKSSLYVNILKNFIRFGLVWFYGMSLKVI